MVLLPVFVFVTCGFAISHSDAVEIEKDVFGEIYINNNITKIFQYTLKTKECTVQILTYGATIRSVIVPDKFGNFDDIVLGFNDIKDYVNNSNPYFGATVGRVANRIANASFTLDGVNYNLDPNEGKNTLHGGSKGFSKQIWDAFVVEDELVMFYLSADGEGGFPGKVKTYLVFNLTSNQLRIKYFTRTDKKTPINLTNHAYFNLAGQGSGPEEIFKHTVEINADRFTVLNENLLPTGEIANVQNTTYDLRKTKSLGNSIYATGRVGFDINYVLNKVATVDDVPQFAAKLVHPPSGRYVTMCTDQPGMQFYTSNSLSNIRGKAGVLYRKFGAFCLEAQKFPDSVHNANFPSTIIAPLEPYYQTTIYQFGVM